MVDPAEHGARPTGSARLGRHRARPALTPAPSQGERERPLWTAPGQLPPVLLAEAAASRSPSPRRTDAPERAPAGGRSPGPFPPSPPTDLMARFLCAVHAPDATPRAFALVEALPGADGDEGPTYAVRDCRTLSGDDPTGALLDAVAAEPQYAGQTTFVMTGGQAAVDALHERGPSAVAVTLVGDGASADADALDVPLQVLVDTFERLYRDGAVSVPGTLDAASAAVDAIYSAADLEAGAAGSDRDAAGDIDGGSTQTLAGTTVAGDGPDAVVVEQSGGEANVSTEVVESPVTLDEASAAAVDAYDRRARVAAATGGPAPDLGEHADTATALALALWYNETSRDDLPATDKADEALAARSRRADRENPQRRS